MAGVKTNQERKCSITALFLLSITLKVLHNGAFQPICYIKSAPYQPFSTYPRPLKVFHNGMDEEQYRDVNPRRQILLPVHIYPTDNRVKSSQRVPSGFV